MSVIKQLEDLIEPVVETEKMELVDLHCLTESGKKVVRLFVDKEGGVKLADCELISSKIGDLLDSSSVVPSSYILEVSSPGIDRVLKKEKDFHKFNGRKIKVTSYAPIDGQRNFIGKIVSYETNKLTIEDTSAKKITIEHSNIAKARLEPDI